MRKTERAFSCCTLENLNSKCGENTTNMLKVATTAKRRRRIHRNLMSLLQGA
jgi:hypothetical protein